MSHRKDLQRKYVLIGLGSLDTVQQFTSLVYNVLLKTAGELHIQHCWINTLNNNNNKKIDEEKEQS